MSSQWPEAWATMYVGKPCSCGRPAGYVRYYPDWWMGDRPKHLCKDCKENQDMALRDLTTKARELSEGKPDDA